MWMQVSQTLETLEIVLSDVAGRQTAVLAVLAASAKTGDARAAVQIRARGDSLRLRLPTAGLAQDSSLLLALAQAGRSGAALAAAGS